MAVTVYKSSDASAPTLTGEANSLVNVLDKCLVAGYGSKTAAGWTKTYSGTNKAVFRAGAGSQLYLRIDDTGGGSGSYKEARVRGYTVVTDVDNGTGLFPTTAQKTNGLWWHKSGSADTTQRPWVIVADNKRLYMVVEVSSTNYSASFFGDIRTYGTNDTWCTALVCGGQENAIDGTYSSAFELVGNLSGPSEYGKYICNNHTGTGASMPINFLGNYGFGSMSNIGGSAAVTYPNPVDTGILMSPVFVLNTANQIRGIMPGLWCPLHQKPMAHGDTFGGVGGLTGRTFIALNCRNTNGQFFLETSDTWDS